MKTVLITAVLGMAALLSACPPIATVEPIYQWGDEKQKVDDPGLVGEWISYEGFFYLNLQRNDEETSQYFTEFTLKRGGTGAHRISSVVHAM